ncbi:MAG: YcaO-like family protein [Gemmatimonadetes bacterium]|nr:YcaO-like family protein [Gemmatimonadota bacterium]
MVIGSDGYVVVDGDVAREVLAAVNGTRSIDEIADLLVDRWDPAVVYYTLLLLESEGVIEDAALPEAEPDDDVRSGGTDRCPAADSCREAVDAVGLDLRFSESVLPHRSSLLSALREIEPTTGPAGSRRMIAVVTDYFDPFLSSCRDEALRESLRLLPVAIRPPEIWIGPELGHAGICFECVLGPLRGTFPESRVALRGATAATSLRVTPDDARTFAEAVGRWRAVERDDDPSRDLVVCTRESPVPERHRVPDRPDCPECGTLVPVLQPPRLRSRAVCEQVDAGLRIEGPERTLGRLEKHVDRIVGPVRHVRRLEIPIAGSVHAYTSSHAFPVEAPGIQTLKTTSRDRSGGKGSSDTQARVSAICEALERYSAVYRGNEPTIRGRFAQFEDEAVDPTTILQFSERQYANREALNARASRFHYVPEPYDPDEGIDWCPAWSLSRASTRFIPASLCLFGFRGPGDRIARADSNGLAAGNCVEEAILQGFFELVERDAVALWWYNRAVRPAIQWKSVTDDIVEEVARLYDELDRDLWVLDLTTDLEIPVFAAVSAPRGSGGPAAGIMLGFGAHLDAGVALRRAITELNQGLPLALVRDDERSRTLLPDHPVALDWWNSATVASEPYLLPHGERTLEGRDRYESHDLLDDIAVCVERARRVEIEVLCMDLTRPEVDLNVVRVFAPGLRHFWPRFAPGRLFDTPVVLEWVSRRSEERGLNPIPMFL